MTHSHTTPMNTGPESHPIEESVIQGCQRGNRQAQRQLYLACHVRLHGLIVRMVGRQDAADVTQQVFLQVFRKIDQFAGHSKFETWLFRLATNQALQHLRKQKRHAAEPLLNDPMSHSFPDEHAEEQKELLERALQQLDPQLRSIFVLREIEQMSYREIAEVVDIPEGTVGSRLNRARRNLQASLTELGWEI